ncbi:MAG: S8 family serine peptidase, partial [Actinomycetota bacterium]
MRRTGRLVIAVVLVAATVGSTVGSGPAASARVGVSPASVARAAGAAGPYGARAPELDRDHVIVRLRGAGAPVARRFAAVGVRRATPVAGTDWTALETAGRAEAVRARLAGDPAVLEIRPSYVRRASTIPDDPQWPTGQRPALSPLRMDRAWDRARGAGVVVAVLDSGVDFDHPDLRGRIITPGLNLLGPGGARDDRGHGTMVAGIIAANRDNGRGIAGIAPEARILPVKVLDRTGAGNDVDIATGIAWAVDRGADIINLSLGGPGDSPLLAAAVANARAKGVVVVAAAGNGGQALVEVPAAIPGVIAVSATGNAGGLAAFSSYGPEIAVAAPGVRITSTDLGRPTGADAYAIESGTSFAAPIVAGVAALVWGRSPGLTAEAVAARIRNTARDRGPAGVDDAYGHGVIDPLAALGGPRAATRAVFRTFPDADAGDLPATALAIGVGIPHAALISPETDEDWYRIALAPGRYRITLPAPSGALERDMDPIVELYDPALGFLATQEFGGGTLAFRITTSGLYALRIRNRNASTAPYTVTVAPVTGMALFEGSVPFALPSDVGSVGIADVTGDGRADAIGLAGADADEPDTLVVAPQSNRRTFAPLDVYATPSGAVGSSLVVGDATGDGKADVVFAATAGIVLVTQGASGLNGQRILGFDGYEHFAIADVDSDGRSDLVAAGPAGLRAFWGAPANPFGVSTVVSAVPTSAVAAAAGRVAAVRTGGVAFFRATGRTFASTTV